jgi:predicted dehydrogenase
MNPKAKLRGIGIGAGYFAPFHFEAWTRIPEVELTAVCDLSETKARDAAARHGISRHYRDWKQAVDREQPYFVDIITPPDSHEEICGYAAGRGIHILCQKPLAPTLEASQRIVENARAADVRFMMHENWRWQPWYRKIKEIADSGDLGTLTHLHSRQPFFRDYPRLLLYETGVHFIDTFRFLLGEIGSVYAQIYRRNPAIRGEDACILLLNFLGGATAIWDASRYNETEAGEPRLTFGELRLDGTNGHLTMDAESNLRIKLLGQQAKEVPYARSFQNFAGDCVYFLQRHFVDCMLSGREFEASGEDYLKTIRAMEAAYESAHTAKVVSLR